MSGNKCPKCQHHIENQTSSCPHCGASSSDTEDKRRKKWDMTVPELVIVLVVLLTVIWGVTAWRRSHADARKSKPRPNPEIVKFTQITNWFDDNEVRVALRNNGANGKVAVSVTWWKHDESVERGESGVESLLRENFTREKAPSDELVVRKKMAKSWGCVIDMQAGEEREITMKLPGHTQSVNGSLTALALPKTDE
jgi:hypothetical protein